MSAARTPGPWYVRTLPDGSGAFIEAKAPGRPYNQEILADDYWDEFSKAADAAFIVKACNAHDELVAALSEFTTENLSDVRALADKLHQNNHRVTGTEAERISYVLHYLERSVRVARAALAKVQSGGGGV